MYLRPFSANVVLKKATWEGAEEMERLSTTEKRTSRCLLAIIFRRRNVRFLLLRTRLRPLALPPLGLWPPLPVPPAHSTLISIKRPYEIKNYVYKVWSIGLNI